MTDGRHPHARLGDTLTAPTFTVRVAGSTSLHLSGELDAAGASALASAFDPLITPGGVVELDLADLSFMDSTGIKALCEAARRLGQGGRIRLVHLQPSVRRVIEISGLESMFNGDAERRLPT